MTLRQSDSPVHYVDGRLRFEVTLEPHRSWRAQFEVLAFVEQDNRDPNGGTQLAIIAPEAADVLDANFRESVPEFSTPESATLSSTVMHSLTRAREDLIALRRHDSTSAI